MTDTIYECVRCGNVVVASKKCPTCGGKLVPYEPF